MGGTIFRVAAWPAVRHFSAATACPRGSDGASSCPPAELRFPADETDCNPVPLALSNWHGGTCLARMGGGPKYARELASPRPSEGHAPERPSRGHAGLTLSHGEQRAAELPPERASRLAGLSGVSPLAPPTAGRQWGGGGRPPLNGGAGGGPAPAGCRVQGPAAGGQGLFGSVGRLPGPRQEAAGPARTLSRGGAAFHSRTALELGRPLSGPDDFTRRDRRRRSIRKPL